MSGSLEQLSSLNSFTKFLTESKYFFRCTDFKVSSFEDILDDSLNDDPYKDILQSLLGYQYEELFNNDGELKNFKVQNNTIILNNQVVPISNLYDIIEKLNSGEIQLLEVEVE